MTRLDQNRAAGQLAVKANVPVAAIKDIVIWGNHANTMYPDVSQATVAGTAASETFDKSWLQNDFLQVVSTRGKAIIEARGASSAASASSSAIDHMRDWWLGSNGQLVSMAIPSEGWYGVPKGLMFSFPCRVDANGKVTVDESFKLDDFGRSKLTSNIEALEGEKAAVADLL
jgi:malate dehydrogenase